MHISFNDNPTQITDSLAYKLDVQGNIRWRDLSACKLTYEDNEADLVTVWVAEKPRTAVMEVSQPDYKLSSRFKVVFG